MTIDYKNLFRCFIAAFAVCGMAGVNAAQAPNPRGTNAPAVSRGTDSETVSRATAARSSVRQNSQNVGRTSARGAVVSNAARGAATVARGALQNATVRGSNARSAINVSTARSATLPANTSRAATARATAVFNDISKIGSGYANCRDAYATCMDQFCANANDAYRRCYCSSRYADFRNTENALDEAQTLLMRFEDNNLNAVDKTAAEVNAMYSATVGEAAIKNDTSAAAKMLDEIGDLLSGKKKATPTNTSTTSLGVLSFNLSEDIDDIWSDGGSSLFSGNSQNLSELEGVELYNAANKQCAAVVSNVCESGAVSNMARSSYSILITQDCNAYQKSIDKKVEGVKQTVRQAEKYLREARLEEYRSHNSADVNECISKVRAAITADTACGANYKRCLDYTGAYINQATGEPIYSPRLFQLTKIIELPGYNGTSATTDILGANKNFDSFLESRKMFATSALDTCRDIQNTVWNEFKRTALIEIAQAQDEKIEEVKMSCVSTMAECYDTQSAALRDFDHTTAQMAGALSAYAARQMCADRVIACASLYGNTEGCAFDGNGKLTPGSGTTSADGINRCGLTALLSFVDSVDTVRINEGCETALKNYATELCTPTSGNMGYPWNCRLMNVSQLKKNIEDMADTYCSTNVIKSPNNQSYDTFVTNIITELVRDIQMDVSDQMADQCETVNGIWTTQTNDTNYEKAFYRILYGTDGPRKDENGNPIKDYGVCLVDGVRARCEKENAQTGGKGYATYDPVTQRCRFTTEYYKYQCDVVNGIWEDNHCYIENNGN